MTDSWTRRSFLATGVAGAAGLLSPPSFAASQDLADLTLKKASDLFRSKAVSSVELTEACLLNESRRTIPP